MPRSETDRYNINPEFDNLSPQEIQYKLECLSTNACTKNREVWSRIEEMVSDYRARASQKYGCGNVDIQIGLMRSRFSSNQIGIHIFSPMVRFCQLSVGKEYWQSLFLGKMNSADCLIDCHGYAYPIDAISSHTNVLQKDGQLLDQRALPRNITIHTRSFSPQTEEAVKMFGNTNQPEVIEVLKFQRGKPRFPIRHTQQIGDNYCTWEFLVAVADYPPEILKGLSSYLLND